jgi:prephenate dehydrogenase
LDATLAILERCACAPAERATLVLDVASVKAPLVPFVGRVRNFVPTHPLAGAESSGAAAARPDLFVERPWAYVPTDGALDARAVAFIRSMGAHPVALEAELHDRVVALTSHVPQLVSTALAAVLAAEADPALARLHGPGLESMLRLARSRWPMWAPIVAANGGSIANGLRSLAGALAAAADAVSAGDEAELADLFERANAFAAALDAPKLSKS